MVFIRSSLVAGFFFLMIRRQPRSTLSSSSAASDVYKRQVCKEADFSTGVNLPESLYQQHELAIFCNLPTTTDLVAENAKARTNNCHFVSCEIRGIVAVSYTHLRAHETVLDIVCRLLLEKKNHKNQ
eukprot:TRINITY_DN42022_c0_g1_i1.p1 TRINITY_DN42022_c0_g1~~TRINITY_DN42022_c0_g1_i1.p1  ORF type:complete len:127 (+),score=23.49 TRINITY_DN42022_c0_g1_i1:76-456(+)